MDERIERAGQEPVVVRYESKPVSFLLMLGQATIFIPKRWRLCTFCLSGNEVTLSSCTGKTFSAPIDQISASFAPDNYERKFVTVRRGEAVFRYQEIVGQLEKEEWDHISSLLKAEISGLGKFNHLVSGNYFKGLAIGCLKKIYGKLKQRVR